MNLADLAETVQAMPHRVAADYLLAAAFLLFAVVLVAAIAWGERDRRRSLDDEPGRRHVRRSGGS